MTDTDSNLERQQQELEALKATFPEPGAISIDALPVDANLQYSKINSRSLPSQINLVPISGKVFLQNAKLNNEPIGFSFQLPEAYPEVAPSIHVLCDTGSFPWLLCPTRNFPSSVFLCSCNYSQLAQPILSIFMVVAWFEVFVLQRLIVKISGYWVPLLRILELTPLQLGNNIRDLQKELQDFFSNTASFFFVKIDGL